MQVSNGESGASAIPEIKKKERKKLKIITGQRFESFFFFFFLGLHLRHMEVPRLGVKSELQPLAYVTAIATQHRAMSATHTTAHSNAGSLTY